MTYWQDYNLKELEIELGVIESSINHKTAQFTTSINNLIADKAQIKRRIKEEEAALKTMPPVIVIDYNNDKSILSAAAQLSMFGHKALEMHIRKLAQTDAYLSNLPLSYFSEVLDLTKVTAVINRPQQIEFRFSAWGFSQPLTIKSDNRNYHSNLSFDNGNFVFHVSNSETQILAKLITFNC